MRNIFDKELVKELVVPVCALLVLFGPLVLVLTYKEKEKEDQWASAPALTVEMVDGRTRLTAVNGSVTCEGDTLYAVAQAKSGEKFEISWAYQREHKHRHKTEIINLRDIKNNVKMSFDGSKCVTDF